ncbi:50S ribosomal protein L25 [bacterium]|nr:50S ribosomal protein L25 [bacterium]
MQTEVIIAESRTALGKNNAKALRKDGRVPATVYGNSGEARSVIVSSRDLIRIYRGKLGKNTPITLQIGGDNSSETVISYRVDRNPLSLAIEHVDFLRITDESRVKVRVPLKLIGSAPGVKLGGMMMQSISSIIIEVSPTKTPEFIPVDLSGLGVNQVIKVKDLANENFVIKSELNAIVVSVTAKGKVEDETSPGRK